MITAAVMKELSMHFGLITYFWISRYGNAFTLWSLPSLSRDHCHHIIIFLVVFHLWLGIIITQYTWVGTDISFQRKIKFHKIFGTWDSKQRAGGNVRSHFLRLISWGKGLVGISSLTHFMPRSFSIRKPLFFDVLKE